MFTPFQFSGMYWGKIRKKDSKPATLRFVLMVHSFNGDLCTRNCLSRGLELSLTIRGWGWGWEVQGWSGSEEGVVGEQRAFPSSLPLQSPLQSVAASPGPSEKEGPAAGDLSQQVSIPYWGQ